MIVISGASGYVGSHLTRRLAGLNKPVRAMVRSRENAEKEGRLAGLEIRWVEADVTNPDSLVGAMQGATIVIHTVAIAIEKGRGTYEEINFQGTINLIEAAKKAGISRFIHMSQLGASAELPYRFLASKGKAEDAITSSGLDWTVFRPSVIWGSEDEFANSFARLIPITPIIFPIIGDENSKFQPLWVEDAVTCFEKAIESQSTIGKLYELGGPEILTLEEIERRTMEAVGRRRWFVRFPMPLLRFIVTVMEAVLPNPPVTRSLLELLAVSNVPEKNDIIEFVTDPRPFTPEHASTYMRDFKISRTLSQYFGR